MVMTVLAACTAELVDDENLGETHACTLDPGHRDDLHQCDCGAVWS